MKKYLLVCLLGAATFLPTSELKSSIVAKIRIITVTIEDYWLRANSDATSGNILQIQIYNTTNGEMVRSTGCESTSCSISLLGLPKGYYLAYVIAQNGVTTKKFAL
ncbi:MAG: T9SS type A sorting domain-containing protein [Bacteroidota bacterium]